MIFKVIFYHKFVYYLKALGYLVFDYIQLFFLPRILAFISFLAMAPKILNSHSRSSEG